MQQTKGKSQIGRGSNVFIQGREFVQDNELPNIHNCYDADDGFKHLKAHVAPAAYASWQEGDTPKCNPDTRTAILNTIMHWVAVATMGLQWILWLNGAAGAGKSVIARSVVDLCLKQQLVTARFFFFRTDPTRNTIKPIVPTLAYQLIQSIPALDSIITSKIQSHPLIFNESLDTQFEMLIFGPLRQLHKETPFEKAIVFLLDGVDECSGNDSQVSVIRTISEFVAEKSVPLLAIFSSRAESHLQMAFNSPRVDNILRRLALDTDYRTAGDIRLFLNVSFDAIKSTHPLKSSIIPKWPEPSLVEEIVDKSSGQFVYASVVIHFISSPRLNPVHQLEIIRGLRSVGDLTPLAQLDALYRHIFSQVHNITRVTAILAIVMLSGLPYRYHLCEILDITDDDIDVALADLTSIISNNRLGSRRRRKSSFSSDDDADIKFLHASLPDFLLDQSRSQQYFIDKGLWYAQLAVSYLNKRLVDLTALATHLSRATCTPQLCEAVYMFNPDDYSSWDTGDFIFYINTIRMMDFRDGGEVYRHQLGLVVRYMNENYPEEMHSFDEGQDITGILGEIARPGQVEGTTPQGMAAPNQKRASYWSRVFKK